MRPFPILLCLLLAGPLAGQTSTIRGRVTDAADGQPLPGVLVTARSAAGDTVSGRSGADGGYRIAPLLPGAYTVMAELDGYRTRRVANVDVPLSATITLDLTLDAAFELNPVVVSASRRGEKVLDAPAHVVTVRGAEIRARPALTTVDHVRAAPGLDVASGGLIQSNVVARGFNNVFSGALLVLTDNRNASVPSLRLNAFYLVPPSSADLERMELLLGPASALYGPNSANGVLHLVTASPFDAPGTEVSVGTGVRASSCPRRSGDGSCTTDRPGDLATPEDAPRLLQAGFRTAGTVADVIGYRLSADVLTGGDWQGFDAYEDSARTEFLSRLPVPERDAVADTLSLARRNFTVRRWATDARVDVRPGDDTELILASGVSQVGNAVDLTPVGAAQLRDWRYSYVQLRGRRGRLFAQAYLNQGDAGDSFLLRTGEPVVDRSRMAVAQIQHGMDVGPSALTYGADVQWTEPRTDGTIHGRNEGDDNIVEAGAYVHGQTRLLPALDLVAALRADTHSRVPDPVVSPRVALLFHPTEGQNLRLTYNRAFSTPSPDNLFLDLKVAEVADGRFQIRALGVPDDGLHFRHDCAGGVDGLCMRSPFAAGFVPAGAGAFSGAAGGAAWDSVVALVRDPLLAATGFDLAAAGIPAPGAADVGTVLRTLNPSTLFFTDVDAASLTPVEALRPTITSTIELGYKAVLGERLLVEVDAYRTTRKDFTGPLIVETPAVFYDPASLAVYLRGYIADPTLAGQVAAAIGGVPNSGLTGVPLGVVTWDHPLADGPNLYLTFRNFGEVTLWGGDVAATFLVTERLSVTGSYSRVSDNLFPKEEVGGVADVPLNAPTDKGSVGVSYQDDGRGLHAEARVRHVGGFPMNSGAFIGDVDASTVLDLDASWRLPRAAGAELALSVQNALNQLHSEFVGAPELGRLALLRLRYRF